MPPKSSRDLPSRDTRDDEARYQQNAVIKDADKTDTADPDSVHGDGSELGLDED